MIIVNKENKMKANKWVDSNIKNLTGQNIIVTGANSGLGLETSKFLAMKGAFYL